MFVTEEIEEEMMISTNQRSVDLNEKRLERIEEQRRIYHAEFDHFFDEFFIATSNGVSNRFLRFSRNERERQTSFVLGRIDAIRISDTMNLRCKTKRARLTRNEDLRRTCCSSEILNDFDEIFVFVDVVPIEIFGMRGDFIDEAMHRSDGCVSQPAMCRGLHRVRTKNSSQSVVMKVFLQVFVLDHVADR